jgi:hypothetical protein
VLSTGRKSTYAGFLALGLLSAMAAQAAGIDSLNGAWVVREVKVAPGKVQALVDNDPAYMGAVMQLSPARFRWTHGGDKPGGTLDDVCEGPRVMPASRSGSLVKCKLGSWGPPGARLRMVGGSLRLTWYDGAILELVRQRPKT